MTGYKRDAMCEGVIAHIGQDWFNNLVEQARKKFALKGFLVWHPSADNILFELCVHGGKPSYMLRFFAGADLDGQPEVASYLIAQEEAFLKRQHKQVIN